MHEVRSQKSLEEIEKEIADNRQSMSPDFWLGLGVDLLLLLGSEHDELEEKRLVVARKKKEIVDIQEKKNVSLADVEVEATDEYKSMRLHEHRVSRVEELIKLAKLNARAQSGT